MKMFGITFFKKPFLNQKEAKKLFFIGLWK